MKWLTLKWSEKHPLECLFYKLAILEKKLSALNFHLSNWVWREWGWINSVDVACRFLAVKFWTGGNKGLGRKNFCHENINRVARGLWQVYLKLKLSTSLLKKRPWPSLLQVKKKRSSKQGESTLDIRFSRNMLRLVLFWSGLRRYFIHCEKMAVGWIKH